MRRMIATMEIVTLIAPDALSEPGAMVAAIDVGSNAIRMGVATRDANGVPILIQRYREAVRLGHDAFTTGLLSPETMENAVEAFRQFRRILDQHQIGIYRATATSAMRDSRNGAELVRRIQEEANIRLELISGEEEARLVHYSISRRVDLNNKFTLLVDMGGGSVEVTLCDNGEVIASQSFKIGTVRLLEMMGQGGNFNTLLSEYLDATRKKIREQIGRRKADLCIATGGNASAIGELAHQLLATPSIQTINRKQLATLIEKLSAITFEERVRDLGLRPDRADVILPAAMVFHEIMSLAGAKVMQMPDAGLLDGVILDMVDGEERTFLSKRRNLIAWTRSLKRKYHVDQKYAKHVSNLSLALFDQLTELHKLGALERLLLEVAGLVHEIGMYIRVGGHHRHAGYVISVSPLLGLSEREKMLLAQVVRYQRKGPPSDTHEGFTALPEEDRKKVWQLSALLRLGIALNKERRNRVHNIRVHTDKKKIELILNGDGDLLLERWAVLQTSAYIEQALGRSIHIDITSPETS